MQTLMSMCVPTQVMAQTADKGDDVPGEQYLNPLFRFDEKDHQAVLQEAENLDLILKGKRGNDVRTCTLPRVCHAPTYGQVTSKLS